MATKNFSSIGGFGVGSTEVLNPQLELKNIYAQNSKKQEALEQA